MPNSSTHPKFVVRMPDDLRDQVSAAADQADCSMNTVLVSAIREFLHGQQRKAVLLDALEQRLALVDTTCVNQIAREGESVNRTTEESSAATHAHIDDLVKEVAAEPVFLTVVFKLPNALAAGALVEQLPFREKVLGTEAVVFGLTTGNAMEDESCAS